jgi:hypothetical protein
MPSSLFNCVKQDDVDKLGKAARQYQKMSQLKVVQGSATLAGQILRQNMRTLVYGEPTISSYRDVADAFMVWADSSNVYVGISPGDPLLRRAHNMDETFPVADVAFDLAKQSGDIEKAFLSHLAAP